MKNRRINSNFEDDRGSIVDLFPRKDLPDVNPVCSTMIVSRDGAVRGNHYHNESIQHFYVVPGSRPGWLYWRKHGAAKINREPLIGGHLYTHEPGEEHAYEFNDTTTAIVMTEGVRVGVDYEKDTCRVPSLIDEWKEQSKILCSVLVPSRCRFDRLLKTVNSVFSTVSDPSRIEVLVRFDADDTESLARVGELEVMKNVRYLVGPRLSGYAALPAFYDEMVAIAKGSWVWIMNDDAHIRAVWECMHDPAEGQRRLQVYRYWDTQLADVPITHDVILQVELYRWGASDYWNHNASAFPIVMHEGWKRIGEPQLQNPVDIWLDEIVRRVAGGRTLFLDGVAVVHERDDDAVLAIHRQM